jgi:hypothetical protein
MKIPPNDPAILQNGEAPPRAASAWREVSHSHLTPSTQTALNISNPNGHGASRDGTWKPSTTKTEQEVTRSHSGSGHLGRPIPVQQPSGCLLKSRVA